MIPKGAVSTLLVQAAEVERAVEGLALGTIIVVCDPDAEKASSIAERVTAYRTAVFVGNLDDPKDRAAAEVFCSEMFQH